MSVPRSAEDDRYKLMASYQRRLRSPGFTSRGMEVILIAVGNPRVSSVSSSITENLPVNLHLGFFSTRSSRLHRPYVNKTPILAAKSGISLVNLCCLAHTVNCAQGCRCRISNPVPAPCARRLIIRLTVHDFSSFEGIRRDFKYE